MTTLANEAERFTEAVRQLARLDEQDDAEDTQTRIATLTPEAAAEVLRKVTSRSGQHTLNLPSTIPTPKSSPLPPPPLLPAVPVPRPRQKSRH